MENVYKCVKDLTKRIIKLDDGKKKMRSKIFIQKSTVAIMTLEHLYKIIHETYQEEKTNLTNDEIDAKISLINIYIESQEFSVLKEIKKCIVHDRPILAIALYHIKEDIAECVEYFRLEVINELYYRWNQYI